MRKWLGLAALFAASAGSAAGQTSPTLAPAEELAPACGSPGTLLADTAGFVVSLSAVAVRRDTNDLMLARLEAQAVADNFQRPARLTLPRNWIPTMPAHRLGDSTEPSGLTGRLTLRVDHRGRLVEAALPESTDVAELNAGLLAAVRRADSTGALAPTLGRDSIALVTLRIGADTAADALTSPFIRVRVPYTRITTAAGVRRQAPVLLPRTDDRPVDAVVDLQFVIGEDGRALPSSLWLTADRRELVGPVIWAVLNSEFTPARSGACPVPQLVQQRIHFHYQYPPGSKRPALEVAPDPPLPRAPAPPFQVRQ